MIFGIKLAGASTLGAAAYDAFVEAPRTSLRAGLNPLVALPRQLVAWVEAEMLTAAKGHILMLPSLKAVGQRRDLQRSSGSC